MRVRCRTLCFAGITVVIHYVPGALENLRRWRFVADHQRRHFRDPTLYPYT